MSHNVARDQRRGGRGTVEARRRRRMRPTLMALEDRRLLSAIVLDHPSGTARLANAAVSRISAAVSGGSQASEGGTAKLTNAAVSGNTASGKPSAASPPASASRVPTVSTASTTAVACRPTPTPPWVGTMSSRR